MVPGTPQKLGPQMLTDSPTPTNTFRALNLTKIKQRSQRLLASRRQSRAGHEFVILKKKLAYWSWHASYMEHAGASQLCNIPFSPP